MTNLPYYKKISSRHPLLDLKIREVWEYRDLILLFTKRNFTVSYKQTLLGPLWLFLNPLLTSYFHMIVFGNIAGLSTDGIPKLLFYFTGTAIWGLFSSCLAGNSSTFVSNAGLFGKVYFPRLTVSISNVLSNGIKFAIQMSIVLLLIIYYVTKGIVFPHWLLWLLIPVILVQLGLLGMSIGIFISSITTKYRDLSVLVGFGVNLWMYATPVVYPVSQLQDGLLKNMILLNPVTAPIELFRYITLGHGTVLFGSLLISWVFTLLMFLLAVIIFNQVERTFMDTV